MNSVHRNLHFRCFWREVIGFDVHILPGMHLKRNIYIGMIDIYYDKNNC